MQDEDQVSLGAPGFPTPAPRVVPRMQQGEIQETSDGVRSILLAYIFSGGRFFLDGRT